MRFTSWGYVAVLAASICLGCGSGEEQPDGGTPDAGPLADPRNAPRDFWITDGTVDSIARQGGVIYLGGDFAYVGPPTGSFAATDAVTGAPLLDRARVNGFVLAVAPDGAGGWYIGGSFTSIDGLARSNL